MPRRGKGLLGRTLRFLAALLIVLAVGLGIWSVLIEPDRLVLREVRLTLPDWPPTLGPLRLALLSDLHAGAPFIDPEKIEALVAAVNARKVDVALLLGDYVVHGVLGGEAIPPSDFAPILGRIEAPLGRYAVLGNHDLWYGGETVSQALESAGIEVLENQAVRLARPGRGDVWLVGLEDLWAGKPDIAASLAPVPEGETVIVMTHNPDIYAETSIPASLLLAGHSHGGQVSLPLFGPPIVPSRYGDRYAQGHTVEDGRQIFVTSGVGTSILPLRLGVPPEIVFLTLQGPSLD